MEVNVTRILPELVEGHIRATVTFWDEKPELHPSATVEVFVPAGNSLSEIKEAAIGAAVRFLREAAAEK